MKLRLPFLCIALALFSVRIYPSELCSGHLRIKAESIAGTCLGLLLDGKLKGLIKPRKAIENIDDGYLLVTDMGGWGENKGLLWKVSFSGPQGYSSVSEVTPVLTKLNLPHEIKYFNDDIYLGEAHQIIRIEALEDGSFSKTTVISELPYIKGKFLHPLTSFIFMPNGDLLVNAGSKTDTCNISESQPLCEDTKETGLRHYTYNSKTNSWSQGYTMYASGLRNSVALLAHSSGTILQAENSVDYKNADEPYEEINVISKNGFYGWPYCLNRKYYTFNGAKYYCSNYAEPFTLLPPHTAPLDMIYYNSLHLPSLTNKLLMSWHGYRIIGNRVVAYDIDNKGRPLLQSTIPYFYRDPVGDSLAFTQHKFNPNGGLNPLEAQHSEVISKWNQVNGVRKEGYPVGLLQLGDGSLLIIDDKNQQLLRLTEGSPYKGPNSDSSSIVIRNPAAINLIMKHCSTCHNMNKKDDALQIDEPSWPLNIEKRLLSKARSMPPIGNLNEGDIQIILNSIMP